MGERSGDFVLCAGLKGTRIAGDDVGDDARSQRNDVADQAGQQQAKQSKRDSAGIALEVEPEAGQISPRR